MRCLKSRWTVTDDARSSPGEWVALRPIERAMARRMAIAGSTPTAAQWVDADVSAALQTVQTLRDAGVPATFNTIVVIAVAEAIRKYPEIGVRLDYDQWTKQLPTEFKIGVAVASARGLVVPAVLADPDDTRATAIALHRIIENVRAGAADRELFEGAIFTVTNIGPIGVHGGMPMPSPGQAAILGVASVRRVPVVRAGRVVPGELSTLTLTIDHRAVDGYTAAHFLRRVADTVEAGGHPPAIGND